MSISHIILFRSYYRMYRVTQLIAYRMKLLEDRKSENRFMRAACIVGWLLTFDNVYHDVGRSRVARRASIIRAMRELYFLDDEYGAVSRRFDSNTRLVVVVYHASLAIPEYVAGRLSGRHQLALETQARTLLHVEVRSTRYHRVRLGGVQPHETLLHWFRLYLFFVRTS